MYTKEQLINFGVEKLADIILSLHQNKPDIRKQLEVVVAGFDSDPKNIIAMIKEEIESIDTSDCIIDEDDYSFKSDPFNRLNGIHKFANQINEIRIHIMEYLLPKSPNQAIEFLLNMLDIHEEALSKIEYDETSVSNAFKQICAALGNAYEHISSLDDVVKLVFDRFMDNKYGVFDNIIQDFKDALGDNGLNLLKENMHKSRNEKNTMTVRSGLRAIAICQADVDAYIQACSITGKPSIHDHLEIAKSLISHSRGEEAIQWLDSMDGSALSYWNAEKHSLKIQALVLCGNYKEAQAERIKWFETTLSVKVYQEILKYAEADFTELFKRTAIQKAFKFSDSYAALAFLKEIEDFEQLTKLVYQKSDILDGDKYYSIRPIADILCKIDPLAATLLYRKMIEPPLERTRSKYYYYPAKDLALCLSLSSKITDWRGYKNHQEYFKELSAKHKRKYSFWSEYTLALNKQKEKDALST